MRALWLERGTLRMRSDVPVPVPAPGEVRVRVLRAGICNTDLELLRGYYPYAGIPGHEFVGVVDAYGGDRAGDDAARADDDGPGTWRGRRVVGEINATCGRCARCRRGHHSHCAVRTVLGIKGRHGAFAEYLCLPRDNLHLVPDEVSIDAATFTEPLAAALEIGQQVAIRPSDRVLVIGDGKLGLLIAQSLALSSCDLLVAGRHEHKLAVLAKRGIATTTVASDIAPGSFDLAVECTGNPSGFALARAALRPRGTLVLKSTYAGKADIDLSSLVVDEITLVGSRCGPFAPALRLLAESRVDVMSLVHGRYGLDDGVAAFAKAQTRGTGKILVDISEYLT